MRKGDFFFMFSTFLLTINNFACPTHFAPNSALTWKINIQSAIQGSDSIVFGGAV